MGVSKYILITAEGQMTSQGYALPGPTRHERFTTTYNTGTTRGPGAKPYKNGRFNWWKYKDGQPNPCTLRLTFDLNTTDMDTSSLRATQMIAAAEVCVAVVFVNAVGRAVFDAAKFDSGAKFATEYRIPILSMAESQREIIGNSGGRRYYEILLNAGHNQWNDMQDYTGNWWEF